MGEKGKSLLMLGIFICLLIIAFKEPEPYYVPTQGDISFPGSIDVNSGKSVVQLSENVIAIVDSSEYSGGQGNIMVLEFNPDEKSFELLGEYNYLNGFLGVNNN